MSDLSDRALTLTRTYDAPRELVWRAWTEPQHVAQWWGPDGFTITILEMDVRPGGMWRFVLHSPDGIDYDNRIVYTELARPARMVFVHGADRDDDPERFDVTVTFEQHGRQTHLTMHTVFPSAAIRDRNIGFGAVELGQQTLEHLAHYLATLA